MRTRACKRNPTAVTSFHVLMLLAWVGLSATGQVHSAATADGHKAKHTRSQQHQYAAQPAAVRSRKLLQQLPFAREANINRLTRVAAAVALDISVPAQITANTGSRLGFNVLSDFSSNGYFDGLAKGVQSYRASTDRDTAQTSSSAKHSSVSGPVIGVTTARTGSDSVVLMQNVIPSKSSSAGSNSNNSSSSNSSQARQAGFLGSPAPSEPQNFDVTLAANLDYSIAGDSAVVLFPDYSLPNRNPVDVRKRRVDPYTLDYDYGQPHALPQTATSSVDQAARLDELGERATSEGATSAFVTGQAVTARVHSTSSSLKGTVTARQVPDNDLFTRPRSTVPTAGQAVTPPVPLVQSGADAAVSGSAEQYKLSMFPSVAYGASAARSNTNPGPHQGGAMSSVLSYTSGTQSVNNGAQSVAIGGCVSIDLC